MILAAETCRNFYFQKQNYKLLSLNNKHVGVKLNRDQTIIKTIQKTIEIASEKIEKTIKLGTVQAAQKQTGPRPARPPFLGPEARQPTAGPPNRPAAASPPPPTWAACQPRRRGAISTVDLDWTVARAVRRIKTDDDAASLKP
jgi:hypothetical protein